MSRRRIAGAFLALLIAAASSFAQSLGDVARQEEARRATGKKAAIVLSDGNLRPSDIPRPAAELPNPTCYLSIKTGSCVSPEELVANSLEGIKSIENAPTESMWRQDAESIRSQIEKTRRSIATLESVIADQGRSASDKRSAEQTLASARQSLAALERRWEKLEMAAGNKRIPREWILPIPTLSSRDPR